MELTREEEKALDQKWENHDLTVTCPRCGKELENKDFGSSAVVQCQTPGCLCETIRGL